MIGNNHILNPLYERAVDLEEAHRKAELKQDSLHFPIELESKTIKREDIMLAKNEEDDILSLAELGRGHFAVVYKGRCL